MSRLSKNGLILAFISIFFSFPLFLGNYQSHDQTSHLARIAEYAKVISEGQLLPRWAGNLNFGYGTPLFIIYYPLAGYISGLLHLVGFSIETSYFLLALTVSILGVIIFYIWIKEKFGEEVALYSTIFYSLLPYRFLTLYIRSGIGEFLSFSLLPLVFLCLDKYLKKGNVKLIAYGGLFYSLIILSHNAISLMFSPIIFLYGVINGWKGFKFSLLSMLFGLGLSALFWIPSLVESKYTSFLFFHRDMYLKEFPKLHQFFYSSWGYGTEVNKLGGLSPQIGPVAFLIVLFAFYFLLSKKVKIKEKNQIVFWIVIFLLGIYISSSYSIFIWQASDFLKKFQFPWRFIAISSFAVACLSPFVLERMNKRILLILTIFFVIFSVQYVRVKDFKSYPDKYYYDYPGTTFYHGEATTMWSGGDPNRRAISKIELIGGDARIKNLRVRSDRHEFNLNSESSTIILDNTIYFPGWRVYVDGNEVPIQFQDPNHKGLITFNIPSGNHRVLVVFVDTKIRVISNFISFIFLIIFVLVVIFIKCKKTQR